MEKLINNGEGIKAKCDKDFTIRKQPTIEDWNKHLEEYHKKLHFEHLSNIAEGKIQTC